MADQVLQPWHLLLTIMACIVKDRSAYRNITHEQYRRLTEEQARAKGQREYGQTDTQTASVVDS
jgi:hypothetical protein